MLRLPLPEGPVMIVVVLICLYQLYRLKSGKDHYAGD